MMGYYFGDGFYGGGMGFFGGFMMIIFWVAIIFFIVWAVKEVSGRKTDSRGGDGTSRTAMDILKERYAKGEIDKAEFEIKRKDLE